MTNLPPDHFHTPTILVIDDEARIRDACVIVLSDKGFDVAAAPDGEEGLRMIKEKHYDIVLVDLMMPTISGFDVVTEVRNHHPDTVVIVITGYATLEHSIEAMKKGAFDFIPKPFTPDQLRAVVDKSLRYTMALQDITESRSRLRVLVNRLTEGVMTTDAKKLIVQANPAFLHMIGYHGEDAVGHHVADLIKDEKLLDIVDQALVMPANTFAEIPHELCFTEYGEEKYYSARCTPFRGRLNENIGTITVLHDITAIKRMDRMKSDFISMVSHEIRSPMNSLLMQLKIILDGLAGDVTAKQQEILQRASEKILNLNNMVTELLDLSRIESGLIAHEKELVDLTTLLSDQQAFHSPYAKEKGITIALDCPASLPPLLANRQNMEEVFANLITNAIKYSPVGGSITVRTVVEGSSLKTEVKDTGFGIGPEDLEKIFIRFYRVKDANTREIHGTGLGLAIVKSIVESHHGNISVASELGRGTTFTVWLPVAEP
ncbi:MAG: hybrid sensor histidine kinase/response regulator [Desulfobacterales bacterium GWB2_56_26]|nr:MAG: hybrid sensor histidine kinase/response regulator [Desulfobacterales bacterium GWB2_56_26]